MGTEDYNKLIDYTNLAYTEYKEGTKLKLNLKTHEISVIEDFNENIKDEENEYFMVIKMQKNNSTGFSAMALKSNKGEIVVTYKGSDFENTLDWEHNINNLPQEYLTNQGQEAILFLDKVLKENGEGNVIIVGHSLGGFLAQVAALNN